jgi:hypothetical protein
MQNQFRTTSLKTIQLFLHLALNHLTMLHLLQKPADNNRCGGYKTGWKWVLVRLKIRYIIFTLT